MHCACFAALSSRSLTQDALTCHSALRFEDACSRVGIPCFAVLETFGKAAERCSPSTAKERENTSKD